MVAPPLHAIASWKTGGPGVLKRSGSEYPSLEAVVVAVMVVSSIGY